MADAKRPTIVNRVDAPPAATAGANAAVRGVVKPDSRPAAAASTAGGVETRAAPRTETPADAAPTGASKKPRPWRVPDERPGTENTPSCNPNYRPAV